MRRGRCFGRPVVTDSQTISRGTDRAGGYPTIGKLTIPEIKPSHIHDLLKPIWVEKRETANRVRGRIETIIAKSVDIDDPDFRIASIFARRAPESAGSSGTLAAETIHRRPVRSIELRARRLQGGS